MAVCTGSCKWFDSSKGYGFITTEGGEDVFVHQTEIHAKGFRSLETGEDVQCVVVTENGKKKATNVTGPRGDFVKGESNDTRNGRIGYPGGANNRNRGYNQGGGSSVYGNNGGGRFHAANGGEYGGRFHAANGQYGGLSDY